MTDVAELRRVVTAGRGFGPGGRRLWLAVHRSHVVDAVQWVQLVEACRAKDRLDRLDGILSGDVDTWVRLEVPSREDADEVKVVVNAALREANTTANTLKQLLAALRLPDAVTGKRPQFRGARGAYKSSGAKVSSLDRARAAKGSA